MVPSRSHIRCWFIVIVESVYEWSGYEEECRQERVEGTLEGHGWKI